MPDRRTRVVGWPCRFSVCRFLDGSWYFDGLGHRLRYLPPGGFQPLSERWGKRQPKWQAGRWSIWAGPMW